MASLAAHPNPTEAEIQRADAQVQPQLRSRRQSSFLERPELALAAGWCALLIYVAMPALLAALICRGGLNLRAAGVAIVRGDGTIASRSRVFRGDLIRGWGPSLATGARIGRDRISGLRRVDRPHQATSA
ncbi:MAG TPA: hypothetical protein VNU68_07130 [Verrucomicrobiae bacterium]|nr:hypothetical protein [Verrucomicrobiae bacterium]